MQQITHDGYCGTASNLLYLPPGVWTVGEQTDIAARTVTQELANYLVGIEVAQVVKAEPVLVKAEPDEEFQEALEQSAQDEIPEADEPEQKAGPGPEAEEPEQTTGQSESVAAETPKAKAKRGTVK